MKRNAADGLFTKPSRLIYDQFCLVRRWTNHAFLTNKDNVEKMDSFLFNPRYSAIESFACNYLSSYLLQNLILDGTPLTGRISRSVPGMIDSAAYDARHIFLLAPKRYDVSLQNHIPILPFTSQLIYLKVENLIW
jgi:hypothetical protein